MYKILFSDLDGTLINTISGETFPKGIWDMKINFDVLDAIKKLNPKIICIVTNQGGIEKGFVNRRNFNYKMEYIIRSITEYTGIKTVYSFCESNNKNNLYRKPNTGMLHSFINRYVDFATCTGEMLMIGDASGKEGQYSDTDKKTAENFHIQYLDVEDFIKEYNG